MMQHTLDISSVDTRYLLYLLHSTPLLMQDTLETLCAMLRESLVYRYVDNTKEVDNKVIVSVDI